ncbi:MAG: ankyrin repeat domain-containing protein [Candidatus Hydrogenedentales bacterium]|jgi:ankyrin repeat protein
MPPRRIIAFALCLFAVVGFLILTYKQRYYKPSSDNPFASAYDGDSSSLSKWLQSGGDPNAVDSDGYSLLDLATGPKGNVQTVKLLLDLGADPNRVRSGYHSPLMNAASWGYFDMVKLLLERGADANYQIDDGSGAVDMVANSDNEKDRRILSLLQAEMKDN